jgi:hypothetical protein
MPAVLKSFLGTGQVGFFGDGPSQPINIKPKLLYEMAMYTSYLILLQHRKPDSMSQSKIPQSGVRDKWICLAQRDF